MNVLKIFIRIVDELSEWIGKATIWLIMAMVFVVCYEVVSRSLFNTSCIWAYDMAIFMFGYAGLWAGAYALKNRYHITVDIVYAQLSSRWKAILDVFTGLLGLFFLILMIVMNWEPAIKAIINNQKISSQWGPPAGHYKLMIPLSGFLFLLQGIANWIRSLYKAITDKELGP